jgi:aromatic-L-amino-acid decarboxylase
MTTGDHMTPEEFRRRGREVVDRIADYWERVAEYPVRSVLAPGAVRAQLPPRAPERGESFDDMLRDVDDIILPGLTHWQSPNFFAYFPANVSPASVLGDLLSSGLGVQGMLWSTSPACTELETHVLDWLVDLLDLPAEFRSDGLGGGVIQDSASSAALCALLAARERTTGFAANTHGCDGTLTAYCSTETHSSVVKAVRIAGLGDANLRTIAVDAARALRPDALAAALREDAAAGRRPAFVCATVGSTSSHALDPLPEIGTLCREHGAWLHVDAAHAGSAALCPEFRWIQSGLESADSYCFNPHKWLFTNFDCDCFWVRDRAALVRALTILPEYLRNAPTASGAVIDYRDWQVPLGRRFRALKLWFVIRHYGAEGLRRHVREHVRLAQDFAGRVAADADWELAAPAPLNLVCFRHRGGDARSEAILERVNASGRLFLTHTKLDGRYCLRLSVGGWQTREEHVRGAWAALQAAAAETA